MDAEHTRNSRTDISFNEMLKYVQVGDTLVHESMTGVVEDKKFVASGDAYLIDILFNRQIVGPGDHITYDECLNLIRTGNILLYEGASYEITGKTFNQLDGSYTPTLSMQRINKPNEFQSGKSRPV
ncbi:hypothetical protein [Pseudomonas sp. EA_5y_Pfl2_R50]|uniref:hypothetical protein n=1 Tax=Pseudomonas sp. EA_5y_Pfl2_R50 TaxID=3088691 RepID=UPI0030DDB46B